MTTTSLSDVKIHLGDSVKAAEDRHERTTISSKHGRYHASDEVWDGRLVPPRRERG